MSPTNTSPTKDAMEMSQKGLNLLSGAAQATGGKVSAKKTKWYLLEFKWDKYGNWHLSDNETDLFIQPPEGIQKIELPPPSEASRILGVWIDPNSSSI